MGHRHRHQEKSKYQCFSFDLFKIYFKYYYYNFINIFFEASKGSVKKHRCYEFSMSMYFGDHFQDMNQTIFISPKVFLILKKLNSLNNCFYMF